MYLTSPPDNFVSNDAIEKPPPSFMGRRKLLGKKEKTEKRE